MFRPISQWLLFRVVSPKNLLASRVISHLLITFPVLDIKTESRRRLGRLVYVCCQDLTELQAYSKKANWRVQPLQYSVAKQSTVLLCGWRQPPQPAPRYSTWMWNGFFFCPSFCSLFVNYSHFWLVVHIFFFNLENVYWGKRIKIVS